MTGSNLFRNATLLGRFPLRLPFLLDFAFYFLLTRSDGQQACLVDDPKRVFYVHLASTERYTKKNPPRLCSEFLSFPNFFRFARSMERGTKRKISYTPSRSLLVILASHLLHILGHESHIKLKI
jgi:hypothetical protein